MSKTKWYQKPIYLLVALALVLSLGIIAVPMAGTVEAASPIYVNGSTGNDGWDGQSADWDGTHGPKKTIKAGIAAVDTPGTVHVAAGTYYENDIALKDGVQVLGTGADVTTIDGDGSNRVVRGANVGSTTKLDGFTITNGSFPNGGGIHLYSSYPTISNCIFSGNSVDYYGGGMSNDNSSPTVTNCIFSGNSANYDGGGMCNWNNSSPTVTNCVFEDNSVPGGNGGGMHNTDSSSPTVTNCIFSGNSADDDGGGMCNYYDSSPMVDNCIFSGNSAYYGGGMYNYFNSSPTVTNCIFLDNSANDYIGGGMYNYFNSSPTVTNCIFSGNSANYGGGMSNYDSSPTVTNCIFHGNSATVDGGGMCNLDNSSPAITNNIIVSNTADQGGGIWADVSSSPTIDYNDVWNNSPDDYYGCSAGANDISQDPLFVNPAAGDYHTQLGSPCIDAGTNVGAPTEDIEGKPRPIDGDRDGTATTDMGAYEYVPPPPPNVRYLHSTDGLFNLTEPIGTQWHELWPFFCKQYHLSSWNDTGRDGLLSRSDRIDMYEKPDGELKWYHVEEVTITLNVTQNRTGEPMYIELEGGYNASVLSNPLGTQWHEIRPNFCRQYELSSWNDTGSDGLHYCDLIELKDKWTEVATWWHVEEVAVDIIVTIEPPPVGGEAYPVNKISILAPWLAAALLLAGGISWFTLRRRRTQS